MNRRRGGEVFFCLLIAMSASATRAEELPLHKSPITSTVQVQVFGMSKNSEGYLYRDTTTRYVHEAIPSYFGYVEHVGEAAVATQYLDYLYGQYAFRETIAIGTYRSVINENSGTTFTRAELWANAIGFNVWGDFPAGASIVGSIQIQGKFGEQLLKVRGSAGNGTSLYVDGAQVRWIPDEGVLVNIQDSFEIVTQFERNLYPNLDYFDQNSTNLAALAWGLLTWSFGELPGTTPSDPLVTVGVIGDDTQVMTCLEGLDEYFYDTKPPISVITTSRSLASISSPLAIGEAVFKVFDGEPGFASFGLPDLDGPQSLTITIGDQVFSWDGLEAFDFLAVNPEGVRSFSVLGEGFGSFDDIPIFSTLFAAGGQVDFTVSVPEHTTAEYSWGPDAWCWLWG